MLNHSQKIQQIRDIFDSLIGENRSAIRAAGELCSIATTVERLECCSDEAGVFHVLVNETEVFQWTPDGARDNFRNLLAAMFGFAKQFAEHSLAPDLSPYKTNCVVNLSEFGGQNCLLRLETTNTASEQRFALSKI